MPTSMRADRMAQAVVHSDLRLGYLMERS
jgi:hypothetical protein